MTRQVSVDADDLALAIGSDPQALRIEATSDAIARLRAALTPPRPTLREKLARAACDRHGLCGATEGPCLQGYDVADGLLPVVEAAVSEAADEAWNAALTALADDTRTPIMARVVALDLRRPTEGSAP